MKYEVLTTKEAKKVARTAPETGSVNLVLIFQQDYLFATLWTFEMEQGVWFLEAANPTESGFQFMSRPDPMDLDDLIGELDGADLILVECENGCPANPDSGRWWF